MENTKQGVQLNEEDLVNNLNLIIKVVNTGAPALANELTGSLRQLYAERNELKQKVLDLESRVAELENPEIDVEIPAKDAKKSK